MPEKNLLSDENVDPPNASPQGMFENNLVAHIRCEIRNGVWKALMLPNVQWLRNWGSTVTLKMTVEEQSALAPGLSLLKPLANAESFTLGLGLSGTAHATRLETITFTYSNAELMAEQVKNIKANTKLSCEGYQNGIMIESDLKIGQFIYDKAVVAGAAGEATSKSVTTPPYSTLQEDITFLASFGGNVTPTWKFTRITVNPNSPLFTATRTNTNEVLITLGPVAIPKTAKSQAQLSPQTNSIHGAGLIGSATASSIQAQTH